jgi:hypothetical protein
MSKQNKPDKAVFSNRLHNALSWVNRLFASQHSEAERAAKALELVQRPEGATLAEIVAATGWSFNRARGLLRSVGARQTGDKDVDGAWRLNGVRRH